MLCASVFPRSPVLISELVVASEIDKSGKLVLKLSYKLGKLGRIDGGVNVEVEHEFEIGAGNRTAFKLGEVHAERCET